MQSMRKFFGSVMLFALILAAGCDSLPGTSSQDGGLTASGVVETVEVVVAPELGGRVAEVYVAEGDAVQVGDSLFRLEDKLLDAQREQAVAAYDVAQANLDAAKTQLDLAHTGLEMAQAALRTAEISAETTNANVDAELLPIQQALDDLYETHEVIKAGAQENVAAANRGVREAQYRLDNFTVPISQKDMTAMEAIGVMKERLDKARQDFEPYKYRSSSDSTRKDLKEAMDEAQSDYDAAVKRMEYETALKKAEAALEKAMEDLAVLADGPDPDDVAALEARITAIEKTRKGAEAAVAQAEVGVVQAEALMDQAEAGVEQAGRTLTYAQSTLDLIDVQMEQLTVHAAVPGVIMVRNVQLGEVILPGATAMTIGQLDELTVTVYIPEDRYGAINLGDHAKVTTDSFSGEVFDAVVTRIADRAEYTPRNVQTQEERKTTVFAIELSVDDPGGKLKPGMPVDVVFGE